MSRLPRLPASATLSTFFIFSCFREGGGWRGLTLHLQWASVCPKQGASLIGGGGVGGLSNISSVSADESRRSWECVCTRVWSVFVKTLPLVYSGWSSGSRRRRKTEAQHPDTACIFIGLSSSASEHTDTLQCTHTHTAMWLWMCVSSAVCWSPLRSAVSRRLVITRKWKFWRQTQMSSLSIGQTVYWTDCLLAIESQPQT